MDNKTRETIVKIGSLLILLCLIGFLVYLLFGGPKPASFVPVTVDFSVNSFLQVPDKLDANDAVIFKGLIEPEDSIKSITWDFDGDGETDETELDSVVYKYSSSGIYAVRMCVNDTACIEKTINIVTPFELDFESKIRSKRVSLKAIASPIENVKTWYWDFGDGSTSKEQNPKHKYSDPGSYTIQLCINDKVTCVQHDIEVRENYIPPPRVKPTINCPPFVELGNPVTFSFNYSKGASSIRWSFGDGKYSKEKSPLHNFSSAGAKRVKVCINGSSNCAYCTVQVRPKGGNIASGKRPNLNCPASSMIGNTVNFSFSYDGAPNSVLWEFGDGQTSTEVSPSHAFTSKGIKQVSVCIDGSNCNSCNIRIDEPTFVQCTGSNQSKIGPGLNDLCEPSFSPETIYLTITPKRQVKINEFYVLADNNGKVRVSISDKSGRQLVSKRRSVNYAENDQASQIVLGAQLVSGQTYTLTIEPLNGLQLKTSTCSKKNFSDNSIDIKFSSVQGLYNLKYCN